MAGITESSQTEGEEEQRVAKFLLNHPKFVEKYLLNVVEGQSSLASITEKLQHLCQNDVTPPPPPGRCANGKQQQQQCELYITKSIDQGDKSPVFNEQRQGRLSTNTKGDLLFTSLVIGQISTFHVQRIRWQFCYQLSILV